MKLELIKTAGGFFVNAKLSYLPNLRYHHSGESKSALIAGIQHDIDIWQRQAAIHHPWQREQLQGIEELKQIVSKIENWN